MKILVASDKFKGSLTSVEACEAIRDGLASGFAQQSQPVSIETIPVADGGDGLVQTLVDSQGGSSHTVTVADALGQPTEATYGLIGDTAIVEMAEASGLAQLAHRTLDPWRASTFGTGELLLAAAAHGVDRIILGIGGSATNDGGSGMARALGFRFFDAAENEVDELPANLKNVSRIEAPTTFPLPKVLVACDVTNPLLGPEGCTRIYGPQKGIAESEFDRHEERLRQLVSAYGETGKKAAAAPGSGAAGGLGFGALTFLNADLRPGFDLVADLVGLSDAIQNADLILTGEGKLDRQTDSGKAPAGVARLARADHKPVHAFCGMLEEGAGEQFDSASAISIPEISLEENLRLASANLRTAAERFALRFPVAP